MSDSSFQFLSVRASLQRLSDARLFYGWVQEYHKERLVLSMQNRFPLMNGDVFHTELHGPRSKAILEATFVHTPEVDLYQTGKLKVVDGTTTLYVDLVEVEHVFTVSPGVRYATPTEPFRICVSGMEAVINTAHGRETVRILDISHDGMGAESRIEIPSGTQTEIEMVANGGQIRFVADVRSCNKVLGTAECYRLGLQVQPATRIDAGRWHSIVDSYIAA